MLLPFSRGWRASQSENAKRARHCWPPVQRRAGCLFLKSGAVEVVKDGVQLAEVSAPGAVFGELALLMDQPHTADVRATEQSEFHVADAQMLRTGDSTVSL